MENVTMKDFANESDHISQCTQILDHMKNFGFITPLVALKHYGCMRLSGRSHQLKHRGHNIKSEKIEIDGKRYAQYSLES